MIVDISTGTNIDAKVVSNYFNSLVNRFFKILPMRENNENTLQVYIKSLQIELLGCSNLFCNINNDSSFITLLSILQYFSDNSDAPIADVRREVFRAISLCNQIKTLYDAGDDFK